MMIYSDKELKHRGKKKKNQTLEEKVGTAVNVLGNMECFHLWGSLLSVILFLLRLLTLQNKIELVLTRSF